MLTNKVENKAIVQLNLESWIPKQSDILELDLKQFLFKELILKEAEFRQSIELFDWEVYRDKYTIVSISNKAIIPQWAFLLIAHKLHEVNSSVFSESGNIRENILIHIIEQKDLSEFEGKRVLIKGCGNENISNYPYILLTQRLVPIVKALSFGEACSMVPLFKN